jgi:hypothetical protein
MNAFCDADGLKLLLSAWARYEEEQPDGAARSRAQQARSDWAAWPGASWSARLDHARHTIEYDGWRPSAMRVNTPFVHTARDGAGMALWEHRYMFARHLVEVEVVVVAHTFRAWYNDCACHSNIFV